MAGTSKVYRFGRNELDLGRYELRRSGRRLHLPRIPMQLLILLVERHGALVTREEIASRLWPEPESLDTVQGINMAINRIRGVLNDDPARPKYIETVVGKGYRFVADLEEVETAPQAAARPTAEAAPAVVMPPAPAIGRKRSFFRLLVPVLAVLILAGIVFEWWSSREGAEAPVSAKPLTSYPGLQRYPAFSPDGTRLAFAWHEPGKRFFNIYVELVDSGSPVRLTDDSHADVAPAWSRDGRSIAFLRVLDPYHVAVMVMPAMGGQLRELTRLTLALGVSLDMSFDFVPAPFIAWSADGKWLLAIHQSTPLTGAHGIVRVSIETGEKRVLTSPPQRMYGDGSVAISPDGRTLAFTRTLTFFASDVYVVSLSEELIPLGHPVQLTFDRTQIGGLCWTSGAHYLVFSSARSGHRALWRISPKRGSKPIHLATGAGDYPTDVAISPLGRYLVYSHAFTLYSLWRIRLAGEEAGQPTAFAPSNRDQYEPAYSPDGEHIAFASSRSGTPEIWVSKQDGSNASQLTSLSKGVVGEPQWSPDGRQIAFESNGSGDWDVYIVDARGGKLVRLTINPANETTPSWSHDRRWIYFASDRTGTYQIWKIPSAGGQAVQLTRNGGILATESVDGRDLYYCSVGDELWKVPVRGGSPIKVLESIYGLLFAPVSRGLYFVTGSKSAATLQFMDFKTHSVRTLAPVPSPVGFIGRMSVSPDEQWMLYTKGDLLNSELMLVENFR